MQKEATDLTGIMQTVAEGNARTKLSKAQTPAVAAKHINHSAAGQAAGGNKGSRKATHAPRWLPSKSNETAGATPWIRKHTPGCCAVEEDEYNGRWRLHYPATTSRSISWTARGHEQAARTALHHLWRVHFEATGETPPWPLDSLIH